MCGMHAHVGVKRGGVGSQLPIRDTEEPGLVHVDSCIARTFGMGW